MLVGAGAAEPAGVKGASPAAIAKRRCAGIRNPRANGACVIKALRAGEAAIKYNHGNQRVRRRRPGQGRGGIELRRGYVSSPGLTNFRESLGIRPKVKIKAVCARLSSAARRACLRNLGRVPRGSAPGLKSGN